MASRRTEIRADRFESKRKNPIELGDDSNLEPNLKPIKIGGKNSILELSNDELRVKGTIDASAITVDGASVQTGTDRYVYETKFIGYYAGQVASFLPMTGYVIEKTSGTSNNEFVSFLAPYNGTVEKFGFRSEIAQDGNFRIILSEATDGTEIPGVTSFRKDGTYDIADDIYQELDLSNPGIGSANMPMTKGRIYNIALTTPSSSNDTNVVVVFKWDITT